MKIEVTDPVEVVGPPKQCYRITTEVMHGDHDMIEHRSLDFTSVWLEPGQTWQDEEIVQVYDILDRASKSRNANFVDASGLKPGTDEFYSVHELMHEVWPSDVTTGHNREAAIVDVKLTYFDEFGIEHNTEIHREEYLEVE